MLKFNLTQEGKTAIAALQNNDKLAITHVRLLQSGDSPSVDLPIRSGAIVVDGTCNGPYAVVDVNDTSANNYLASAVALLSNEKSIAELYSDENASGYEVVLSAGMPGRNEYPSIKYRTQTWASKKIPTRVDIMKGAGDDCDILLSFGSKGGDPSQQEVSAKLTLGDNFPKTITFSNGDIWETDDTVSTTGVKNGSYSYGASSEDGETSIRPLYSKVFIQKETNKQLKLRLSCQFDGAEKCKFNTTSINLPYASRFREGVVRFTDTSNPWISDGQRYNTVYSAADVDKKIAEINNNLGNLTDYAKKAEENTFAENNTFTKNVTVNGEIGGAAVATRGMNVNARDAMVVSLGYADDRYLSKTDASTTYLTKTDAADTYLTQTDANAAANNYAKLNGGNTFTGDVNTFKEVNATKFSGNGVSSNISADAVNNGTKLPTCAAVATFVDNKTGTLAQTITALQGKDNDLQSQIDGINAGQNLADIVDTTDALAVYDISHLKARDDQHGAEGATWAIGDKVQVLGGGDVQSSVYELVKGDMPEGAGNIAVTHWAGYYWRYIGVYGTNAYTKSEIDTKVIEINNAIGTKADQTYVNTELAKKANTTDVYSKTEADGKFAQLAADNTFTGNNTFTGTINTFNGVISGSAVTSDIATDAANQGVKLTTSSGVSSFVTKVVDDKINDLQIGSSYLKLISETVQTVASSVDFNGTIGGTAVAEVAQSTEAGRKLVTVDYANEKLAQLASNNNFTGATNTFQAITATNVSANAFTGDGVTKSQMSEEDIRQDQGKVVSLGFAENRYVRKDDISSTNKIGAMGLFLYTGGDFKAMGTEVHGSLLHAVGMQLPMDGVVSWSQGTAVSTAEAETTWKLLNNTIAGEPCLVLAIRVG